MENSYKKITVPEFCVNKSFSDFSKKDALVYFEWFEKIKGERVRYLKQEVERENPKHSLNYTRNSFSGLTKWLISKIDFVHPSDYEVRKFNDKMKKTPELANIIKPINITLAQELVSIIFDIGIYYGEMIIKNCENYKWGFTLKPKSYVHYAQPILIAKKPSNNSNPRFFIENEILFSKNENIKISEDFLLEAYDYVVQKNS